MRTKLLLICLGVLLLACGLLAGCSGLDDLRVRNDYPFTIRLRFTGGAVIGTVPPHDTVKFDRKAGYDGDKLDTIAYETSNGKQLGKLSGSGANARRDNVSSMNGAAIWSVTVGP